MATPRCALPSPAEPPTTTKIHLSLPAATRALFAVSHFCALCGAKGESQELTCALRASLLYCLSRTLKLSFIPEFFFDWWYNLREYKYTKS